MRRYVLINSGGILVLVGAAIIVQHQILGGSALPGGHMKSAYRNGLSGGTFGPSYMELLSTAVADAGNIMKCYLGGMAGEKISQLSRYIIRNGRKMTGKDLLGHVDRALTIAGIVLNGVALG